MDQTIKTIKTSDITVSDKNPNRMPLDRFELLISAIKKVGFLQPILVREISDCRYQIVDGHHRFAAAQSLGIDEMPAMIVTANDNLANALQIGMNQLRGQLDLSDVANLLEELQKEGWSLPELELTGFRSNEIESLLSTFESETSIDDLLDPNEINNTDETSSKSYDLKFKFQSQLELDQVKIALTEIDSDLNRALLKLLHLRE